MKGSLPLHAYTVIWSPKRSSGREGGQNYLRWERSRLRTSKQRIVCDLKVVRRSYVGNLHKYSGVVPGNTLICSKKLGRTTRLQ